MDSPPSPSPSPPPAPREIQPEDISLILTHLSLTPSTTLPSDPIPFLHEHIYQLPPNLLRLFTNVTTPRTRSSIPVIKSRRLLYASTTPPPAELTAERGRLRWPLLYERMGGLSLPFLSSYGGASGNNGNGGHSNGVRGRDGDGDPIPNIDGGTTILSETKEEEQFGVSGFMDNFPQHVKKLGGLLREYEEEREFEMVREARRVERSLEGGEEFDSESDDDGEMEDESQQAGGNRRSNGRNVNGGHGVAGVEGDLVNQDEVRRSFERKLLELFVDGLDTINYDSIDFTEPPIPDKTLIRDMEDRYFDSETPHLVSPVSEGTGVGGKDEEGIVSDTLREGRRRENGDGEYDY